MKTKKILSCLISSHTQWGFTGQRLILKTENQSYPEVMNIICTLLQFSFVIYYPAVSQWGSISPSFSSLEQVLRTSCFLYRHCRGTGTVRRKFTLQAFLDG